MMLSSTRDWPADIVAEFETNANNGCVGNILVSETETLRVWHLRLAPGTRSNVHRHVNDYFWSSMTAGRARSYFEDGRVVEGDYHPGQTRHFTYAEGESMCHCVQNIGDTELLFATVEFLNGPNAALPVPNSVRMNAEG
ncbi:hypothetical protein [Devosia sp.]|uniref:hypothetical protein n=1 Tax=Devosia sp. TaxID=1871048 RepID=UPI0035B43E9B